MASKNVYTKAIWSATVPNSTYPQLTHDLEVDVAVVGGGITGITTAYYLAKAGKRVAVLEAKHVGMGTTGSSTGNLYATANERLHTIASKHNEEAKQSLVDSRLAAINFIEQRVQEYSIECEFKRVPWYFFATEQNSAESKQVEKEWEAAREAGLTGSNIAPSGFPYPVASITCIDAQAQFNPLRYVQQLAAAIQGPNCHIFENTKVLAIEDGSPCVVRTSGGVVKAAQVVQATHSPKGIYAVHAAMEVYRENAFAVRLKGKLPAPGVYWHLHNQKMYSVRPYSNEQGDFLLVLDASYKVGHKEHTEELFKEVEAYMRSYFDVDKIEYSWAAQNYKPADCLPYIGTSPMEKNIYIATGFSADGLTYGTLAAMIIGDTILGKENKWAKLYDPKRFTPVASAPRFIKENIGVAGHLIKDYLFKGDEKELQELAPGEAKVLEVDDHRVAAYRDDSGKIHAVSAVCTHLGCLVHWNNGEKSWDCPCHGSRFGINGEVLEGPAINDLPKRV